MIVVAIVSPYRFQDSVNKALFGHDFDCEFRTFVYDQVTDIDRICVQCRDTCSVILFTGELGYHYMCTRYPDFPIPAVFTIYGVADVLSILLSFHIRHPEIPLSRVYLDFLTPQNDYMRIQDYLPPEQLPQCFKNGNYDYTTITGQASQLWQERKIDFVISRSINNLHAWQQLGIPYEAVYPTERMIRQSIEEAVDRELLKNIEDYSTVTAVVFIPANADETQADKEYRQATLYKFLVDLRRLHGVEYSIQQGYDRFICRCSMENGAAKALNFQKILQMFQRELEFNFSIGIGIHANEQSSLYHAEQALLESVRYGSREGFLVSGEPEVMTGPLSREQAVRYSYQDANVTRFARKLGIGNANLLRLVGMYRSDPKVVLTAAILEPLLGVTTRSTRRILQKLYDMGIITPASDLSEGRRGRPVHRYTFVPEALERALSEEV